MNCPVCNTVLENDTKFCHSCGASLANTANAPIQQEVPIPKRTSIPNEYQPLGAWTYFWLSVLFSIPVIGFIFLIVFSCSNSNINRRNFARSFWCPWIIFGITLAVTIILYIALYLLSYFIYAMS